MRIGILLVKTNIINPKANIGGPNSQIVLIPNLSDKKPIKGIGRNCIMLEIEIIIPV
jgi:hypothetical protein